MEKLVHLSASCNRSIDRDNAPDASFMVSIAVALPLGHGVKDRHVRVRVRTWRCADCATASTRRATTFASSCGSTRASWGRVSFARLCLMVYMDDYKSCEYVNRRHVRSCTSVSFRDSSFGSARTSWGRVDFIVMDFFVMLW